MRAALRSAEGPTDYEVYREFIQRQWARCGNIRRRCKKICRFVGMHNMIRRVDEHLASEYKGRHPMGYV